MNSISVSEFSKGSRWIGAEIPRGKVMLIMGVTLQMALISSLQPLFLKALVIDQRLTAEQVGLVAALELLAIGATVTLAMMRLRPNRLPLIASAASAIFCAVNLVTAFSSAPVIMGARLVAGCCSGLFLWLLAGMMTRSTLPTRISGLFLALQGAVGLISSALLANFVIPRFGSAGCFLFLASVGGVATVASAWLPKSYERISSHRSAHVVLPTGLGFVALCTISSIMAGIVAAWVLLPLLSRQFGYPGSVTSIGMPLSLAMQVVGGLSAATLASRLTYRSVLPVALAIFAAMLAALLVGPGPAPALLAYAVFGFLWMFLAPFGYSYMLAMDQTRASVMFMSPAQLLGAGIGPLIASLGVIGNDVRGGVVLAIALLGVALASFALATKRAKAMARHP